jgi:hypothetical protein
MPYKSDAQRRFFHSAGAAEAGITPDTVQKFDLESKGAKLPEKVPAKPTKPKPVGLDALKEKIARRMKQL